MKKLVKIIAIVIMAIACGQTVVARTFNDKVLNRPYADLRRWHLGFSIGFHTEDIKFSHNGLVTENGESWYMEQPSFQPGFCVNGLIDFRLSTYFNLRFNPGMYFGTRDVRMIDINSGETERQSIKSAYVVTPIDLKFSSERLRNLRPYMTTGIMPAFDVSKKRNDLLRLKNADVYWTIGFGLDSYLPYFKFIPEIKFCLGLTDALQHDRADLTDDPDKLKFTEALKRATSKMIVLTFYFE
jgi:hypothetical protein